jgi:hypothetical protein
MNAVMDCEVPSAIYRVVEGGETVPFRRNDRWRVEFFCFKEKTGRGSTRFRRGKEHMG